MANNAPRTYTLSEAEAAIVARLEANAAACVDRVGRFMLSGYDERLRGWLSIARSSRGPAWFFGENWNGPALADVIRTCAALADTEGEVGRRLLERKVA